MSRSPPPPQSRARSMENGLEEAGGGDEVLEDEVLDDEVLDDEVLDDEVLDDEVDASRLESFMRDRRRARSLPACLLEGSPGANGRKKSVKFADSMGQSLARVKHFSTLEEPQVPSKVLSRHRSFPPPRDVLSDLCHGFQPGPAPDPGPGLLACFPEPRDVERRVRQLRVCLERVTVTQSDVRGQIRVLGEDRDPEVGIRYTFNDWLSHVDAQAAPAAAADAPLLGRRFVFTVYAPPPAGPGAALHFAVYLRDGRGEAWDNNGGGNYTLRHRGPRAAFQAS